MATPTDTPLPLDDTLDFLRILWGIEHGLQRASKRMEAAIGITGPQRLVLRVLKAHPDITAHDLAAVVQLHPSTLTGVLQRLERKGLIARTRDEADNRRVRLRLRPEALPLADRKKGTVESRVRRALARQPARHVAITRNVLAAIAVALEDATA
jgi:DNA-binding MarR family transcriptional regulator